MSPVTHFLISWTVANVANLEKRERMMVTAAGVVADLDALGGIAEILTKNSDKPLLWYSEYHHVLAHNLLFCLLITALCIAFSKNRVKTGVLSFAAFHLHLAGDYAGAMGPDGFAWPISYFWPFSTWFIPPWNGMWELDAWPNYIVTFVFLGITFYLARRRGFSPLEMVSKKVDRLFVETLRKRFGEAAS